MTFDSDTARLLLSCEQSGLARPYGEPVVRLDSEGREVFVVSDLHVASGKDAGGRFSGLENFFADAPFERFVRYCRNETAKRGLILVINGDFVDFLRITEYPRTAEDYHEWRLLLEHVGIRRTVDELQASVTPREKIYGLKTHESKSIYRLSKAMRGHQQLFLGLARLIRDGARIVIVKGNHDLEWMWPGVRNHFRLALSRYVGMIYEAQLPTILTDLVAPNVVFADKSVAIDEAVYIEHGHCYDKFSQVRGDAFLEGGREINLPFGSFFNRYLINRVELVYPFLDNVRPRDHLLPMLFKEHFILGVLVFLRHIPLLIELIPKRYFTFMFSRMLWYVVPAVAVLGLFLGAAADRMNAWWGMWSAFLSIPLVKVFAGPFQCIVGSALSFAFIRFIGFFKLSEAEYLEEDGRKYFQSNGGRYRLVCFGHTHNPDQLICGNERYWNSGTWIPIIEATSAQVRHDRTYTVVRFGRDPNGEMSAHDLMRWNDDAGRLETVPILGKE